MHDEATPGLKYNNQRMYHTQLGRFITTDPWMANPSRPSPGDGYPDGMNRYAGYHVLHGGVDPYGEDKWSIEECKEYFNPSENFDAVADKRSRTEDSLWHLQQLNVDPSQKGYEEFNDLVNEAKEAYNNALDVYRFWVYMRWRGCDCCDFRNEVNHLKDYDWDDGLNEAKYVASAVLAVAKKIAKSADKALPIKDLTSSIGKYKAYKKAVRDLTVDAALWQARTYHALYPDDEDCANVPDNASWWYEVVDDYGRDIQK